MEGKKIAMLPEGNLNGVPGENLFPGWIAGGTIWPTSFVELSLQPELWWVKSPPIYDLSV